jgi:MFS superfamily sulfate permease-like transporter
VIFGLRRLAPRAPGPLAAVVGGIAAVKVFGLDVPTVGVDRERSAAARRA